jgi:hypothetical protein
MRLRIAGLIAVLPIFLFGGCEERDRQPSRDEPASPRPLAVPSSQDGSARRVYYVPVYSHIYYQDSASAFDLAATLSVRNTDPQHGLGLTGVNYYDTHGRPLRSYLHAPRRLAPLATAEFVVPSRDASGGSGANFLVELTMDSVVTEPVVEAVMIGISGNAGVSFVSPGRMLRRP